MEKNLEYASVVDALANIKERMKYFKQLSVSEQEALSQEYSSILISLYRLSNTYTEKKFEEKFEEFKNAVNTVNEESIALVIERLEKKFENIFEKKIFPIQEQINSEINKFERLETAVNLILEKLEQRSYAGKNKTFINEILSESKTFDCEFYIDSNNAFIIDAIFTNLKNVLSAFDFQLIDEKPAIQGSWIKKAKAKIVSFFENDKVHEKLKDIESAVNKQILDKPQSEIDLNQAKAISELLKSVEGVNNAAFRIGSLLILKITENGVSKVLAVTLTTKDLNLLTENPKLLYNPQNLLITLTDTSVSVPLKD